VVRGAEATPTADADSAATAPEPGAVGKRILVLIGDGEAGEPEDVVAEAVAAAEEAGVTVHTIGVGTAAGAGMLMPEGRYQLGGPVVDERGQRAVSHLQEARLRDIAGSSGGIYVDANDATGLTRLGGALRDPGPAAEIGQPDAPPFWVRYDLVLVLGAASLCFVVLESLLDALSLGVHSSRKWASRAVREPA
jgi:Ca-activated chloride channel family protein